MPSLISCGALLPERSVPNEVGSASSGVALSFDAISNHATHLSLRTQLQRVHGRSTASARSMEGAGPRHLASVALSAIRQGRRRPCPVALLRRKTWQPRASVFGSRTPLSAFLPLESDATHIPPRYTRFSSSRARRSGSIRTRIVRCVESMTLPAAAPLNLVTYFRCV